MNAALLHNLKLAVLSQLTVIKSGIMPQLL